MSDHVYIVGISMTQLGKFPGRSVKQLVKEAVDKALADAGCTLDEIQAAWFSNTRQGLMEGQNVVRGQCALRSYGFQGLPITNVENACASGSTAMRDAMTYLRAGMYDVALVVGADKMFFPEKREDMFRAFLGGADVHDLDGARAVFAEMAGTPFPDEPSSDLAQHSFLMDMYASAAKLHMRLYGTTQRQMAAASAKNHGHSALNPLSQYRHVMSTDDVLNDPVVAWPLTRAMCAPISDGAAAAVLCNERAMKRFGRRRAVRIDAISLASGTNRAMTDMDKHIGAHAARLAYEAAGIRPDDVAVAEVHDACSFAEILQVENLGFCARGEGGHLTEAGETSLGGRIPVNPSGGLVSKGHPVGATGIIQLYELVTQLRGEAGSRQVEDAKVAAAENGGGFWGLEEAATTVTLLTRA